MFSINGMGTISDENRLDVLPGCNKIELNLLQYSFIVPERICVN